VNGFKGYRSRDPIRLAGAESLNKVASLKISAGDRINGTQPYGEAPRNIDPIQFFGCD
jgi:hypothetical protein